MKIFRIYKSLIRLINKIKEDIMAQLDDLNQAIADLGTAITAKTTEISAKIADLEGKIAAIVPAPDLTTEIDAIKADITALNGIGSAASTPVTPAA